MRGGFINVLFVFIFFNGYSQINSWNHKLYTTADGLPSNVIRNTIQDKDGFLWLATESGLCRFDGDEFMTLVHNPNDSSSIPTNFVHFVNIIPDGRLLVTTGKGLYIMDPKTHRGITLHLYTKKGWESLEDNVNQVLVDSNNNRVIIFTSAAVHVFTLSMKKIASVTYYADNVNAPQLGDFALNPVLLNKGDVLFIERISGQLGLFSVKEMKINNLKNLPLNPLYPLSKRHNPNIINKDSSGNIWMHFDYTDTLFCMLPAGKLLSWPLQGNYTFVQTFNFPSANRMLWSINTDGKPELAEYPYTEMMSKPGYGFSYISKSGFPGLVASLFIDKDKNWWLSSSEGLYFLKHEYNAFNKIALPVPYHNLTEWQYVSDIEKVDSENLLITTWFEHCFLYDTKSNTIQSFLDTVPLSNSLYYSMNEIASMKNNRFLIIGGSQNLTFQDKKLMLGIKPQNEIELYYKKYSIKSLYQDKEGILWNSFYNQGLTSWDSITKTLKNYVPDKALMMPHFTGITEDDHGDLWLININQPGLVKFQRATGAFEAIHNKTNGIAGYKVLEFITAANNNTIFIAHHDGVLAYNMVTGSVKNITMYDGLPSNIVLGLFYYNHHLFISSPNGWVVMNTDDYTMKILKQADGIDEDITAQGYYLDESNKILYVGGKAAVYKADLQNLLESHINAKVVMNELKVNDTNILLNSAPLLLKHDENNISLSVSSIDFYSGINKKYFYRITVNGKTSGWQNNRNSKKFNFINLAPGNYTIEVKSKNANNEWSINTASLDFIISKPWYNTLLFYALCFCVVVSALYSLYRYRINQILKMQRLQQRISSDLHDDIGASLTSINILSQLSQQQKINGATRNEYLHKINEQTTEVIEALRDIVWSINPKNDKLGIILARVKRYSAELLESKNIAYSFNTNITSADETLNADIRQNLYLIFKEALNNLAKYSGASEAVVTVNKKDGHIHLEIKDNGCGFDAVNVTKGNGIENMQRRAKAMNAQFKLSSTPGLGTVVTADITL